MRYQRQELFVELRVEAFSMSGFSNAGPIVIAGGSDFWESLSQRTWRNPAIRSSCFSAIHQNRTVRGGM